MGGSSVEEDGGGWYFSRKEIEENSPSRRDGMCLRKETCLRKSYCRFLEDLGKRFKLLQVTIATAIILCHRFFLRQSHSKNDSRIIATACMFLACKAKETVCSLKDIVITSYKIIHGKDFGGNSGSYEVQKDVVLTAEYVVLATLGFELNVPNPYKPLVEGIKRLFKVGDQRQVAQVAWSLVNDAVRTSLLLQFQAHYIAAGAIFLAAKLLNQKPIVPWKDSDIGQLDDVLKQMLDLYGQVPQVLKVGSPKAQPPRTVNEAPRPSSRKRKAVDCPDQPADRKQQRVEYLSEDRHSDRNHKRHDRSYDRGHVYDRERWYPSSRRRLEDNRWRGGHREYDRERVRGH